MSLSNNNYSDTTPKWRSWMHIVMGVVYMLFAALVFSAKKFANIELGSMGTYGLSGLLLAYGLFRIWRGATDLRKSS